MVVRRCSNGSTWGRVVLPIGCKPSSCASLLRRSPNGSAALFLRIAPPTQPFPMLAIDPISRWPAGYRAEEREPLGIPPCLAVDVDFFRDLSNRPPCVIFSPPMRCYTCTRVPGHREWSSFLTALLLVRILPSRRLLSAPLTHKRPSVSSLYAGLQKPFALRCTPLGRYSSTSKTRLTQVVRG